MDFSGLQRTLTDTRCGARPRLHQAPPAAAGPRHRVQRGPPRPREPGLAPPPDPPRRKGKSLDRPANAELTANGHSSMTSSSLALAAVLMDESAGAGGNSESLGIELL